MSGDFILAVLVDPRFTVDIDNPSDWVRAEWLVQYGGLDMVTPLAPRRPLPADIRLLVMDFDGVITDNRVWVDEEGHEMVAAYRSDSMGLHFLRQAGVEAVVISTETNPVVAARCRKMNIPVFQGLMDKTGTLKKYIAERGLAAEQVVYLGNDTNDIACFPLVGCAVVVADAQTDALRAADLVLTREGGRGAVRELCEMILQKMEKRS
jgi:N-acylneuraminate cytidylyltransferase